MRPHPSGYEHDKDIYKIKIAQITKIHTKTNMHMHNRKKIYNQPTLV
jgi:hypothetical protein